MPLRRIILRKKGNSGDLPPKSDHSYSSKTSTNAHFPRDTITTLSKSISLENRHARKSQSTETELQYKIDARTLTATELRNKYTDTYVSWRNMKQRGKNGAIIDPAFMDFASFLVHIGPRPNRYYTLDRLDNKNPTYGPGLCEWRDKQAQANNRGPTIFLTHKGECLPLTTWASRTNQKADTLRSRKVKGWSDSEIIEGRQAKTISVIPESQCYPDIWPGNLENRKNWEINFQHYGRGLSRDEYVVDYFKPKIARDADYFQEYWPEDMVLLSQKEQNEYHKRRRGYEMACYYYNRSLKKLEAAMPKPLQF